TYPLPNEDQEAAAQSKRWRDYYRPDSPAAIHLADECARATILAERAHRARQAEIERQRRNARKNWDRRRKRRRDEAAKLMQPEPLIALGTLGMSALGCEAMAFKLGGLIKTLQTEGYLPKDSIRFLILFQGQWPPETAIKIDAAAYTLHSLNLVCTP